MSTIRLDFDQSTRVATITFDEPDSPVNTMSLAWQADLAVAAERLAEMRRSTTAPLRGVILASAKTTFFAGAQLDRVMQGTNADGPRVFDEVEAVKRSFRTIETLGCPVVACVNGAALGGGWEVALAAHARIAVDDAKTRLGTPEVTLGLIPAAGGITTTVRLLGLQRAYPYLVEGRVFSSREALELGLVTELVSDASQLRARALAWIDAHAIQGDEQAQQPWDRKGWQIPGGTPADNPDVAQAMEAAKATLAKKTRGLYPAATACLAAMIEGAQVDVDTALRIESHHLAQVMPHPVARNMISAFFFDTQELRSGRRRPQGFARWKPARVGVIGAGMMGAGIAHAFAARGIDCVLTDTTLELAQAGAEAARRVTGERVAKGAMTPAEQQAVLARIHPTAAINGLRGCDLIIEAVFEQREVKAQVTRAAEPMLADGGVFASNTSTLPITGLAAASSARPERFVGLHFFSPVHRMPLVEIIRGQRTSDETIARACDVVTTLGKTPIIVNDSRGFFTSRVFGTFVMEGAAMLDEGVPAAVIENAALAAGMPVGPLAVMDETSLALSLAAREQARADLAAEGVTYVEAPGEVVIQRMVREFERKGRAAGGGFYDYPTGQPKRLWPRLAEIFGSGKDSGAAGATFDAQELEDRFLYRQAVETARCLHEGVLTSVAEANLGSILGIGFPAWTGGALRFVYADPARFFTRAAELAQAHGARFAVDDAVRETLERMQPSYG